MSAQVPVALYGLEVPPGEIMIPAAFEFPGQIRITMAALDPTAPPENEDGEAPLRPRATLKLVKERMPSALDDDLDDDEFLQAMLANGDDDSEESEDDDDDDEPNGGPSDPAKSKKAKRAAAIMQLMEATRESESDESDEEMANGIEDAKPNGVKPSKKGKEPATDEEEDSDEESDSEDGQGRDIEEFVVCTLDPERNWQQPLDISIGAEEKAWFMVNGHLPIHLTGNYVIDPDASESSDEDSDDDEYDLEPDMEDLIGDEDISSDELDEIETLERIKELESDEEEVPKLVTSKKGKKRPAEDDDEGLDDMIAKEAEAGQPKLSKKQLKKLKNNKGEAVAAKEDTKSAIKETSTPKSDKKVQFAKNLEQGPTGSAEKAKHGDKKAGTGVRNVQGVTIDDRKVGTGRAVKNNDKVSMRYIGKLQDGSVFDSNKKGSPFSFKVGKGEVIKGWDIGIAGMTVGGERRITIPPSLAYGSRKMDGIPANSTLIFDVKLLEIK